MAIITRDTKLSDIVISDPSSITVLNRFEIYLGLGDKTVKDICEEKDMDENFFSTILNTYVNEDYFPEAALKSYSISKIVEYFSKTNNYYLRFQIPNIERHFNSLIDRSNSNNNNLELLRNFFNEVKNELITRIEHDSAYLYPQLSGNQCTDITCPEYQEENDSIEEKLNDLINMFVIHLRGEYDVNLCHAVLVSILSLQKDIRQNNRIRYRILIPFIVSRNY